MIPQNWVYLTRVGILTAIYFGAAKLGLSLAFVHENVTLVWPPTGIALAALLLFGYRLWPGIALGAFLANATHHEPIGTACGIALGNTLEALVGAYLLRRFVGFHNALERLWDVAGLVVFAAGLSTMVSATIGVASLCLGGIASWAAYGSLWRVWWLGDALGDLVVAPLLLTWAAQPRIAWQPQRIAETAALLVSLVLVSQIVFGGWLVPEIIHYPPAFTIFPFVIWAALRFGQRGAVTATFLVSSMAVWGTTHQLGPFNRERVHESLMFLHAFTDIVSVTAMLLAAVITERQQVEEALRHSEAKNRALLNAIPDMMFRVSRDGTFLDYKAAKYFQPLVPPGEFLGKRMHEVLPPEIAQQGMHYVERALISGDPQIFEYQLPHDHEMHDFEARLILSEQGELLILVRDFTERKRMEESLRQSQQKYESLVNSIDGIVWEADAQTFQFSFVSQQAERLLGYPVGQWLTEPDFWRNHIHPDDCEWTVSFCVTAAQQKRDYELEYRMVAADGRTVWLRDIVTVMVENDQPITLRGVMVDITERKQVEEALQESEKRFRALIENSLDAIALVDTDGVLLYLSPSTVQMLGYTVEEVVGQNAFEQIHPDDREYVKSLLIEMLHNPEDAVTAQFRVRHTDGSWRWIDGIGKNMLAEPGVQAIVVNYRDITEKRRMESELLKVEKLKSLGVLAGGIAHDFNNILTGILGNISLAAVSAHRQEEVLQILSEADKACLRACDLTQQLLTFAKGGAPILQTASMVDLLVDSARFALRGSNVRCEFSIPDDLSAVEVDTGQMSQVIHNLVINAQQAMPQGGTLKVRAENVMIASDGGHHLRAGKYVKIAIEDEGIGIPEEHLPRIFDPYFTTKQQGSGLGLATAYSVVKRHEGLITVESKLGAGTTFHIYLPASSKTVPTRQDVEEVRPASQRKILLMDDEEVVRKVTGDVLTHIGYTVEFARDGTETIEMYKQAREADQPFDAVIMDLTVPGGMGGKETIERLLAIDPEVKAIVSSGYSNDPIMAHYQEYGFRGVLTKPYRIADLRRVLHRVVMGKNE